MALHLEVSCGEPGEVGVVSGDAALGGWDLSKAIRLTKAQDANVWRGDVPVPTPEAEFKLVIWQAGAAPQLEPLAGNRKFPAAACSDGCTLRMHVGEARIAIEASAEMIEASARQTRKLEARAGSELQANIDRKGDNAYYHAHNRAFEVPADAKVITGPGLITGGAPVLLEAGATVDTSDQVRWLKDFSWSDSKAKVKVYVPIPEGLLPAEGADGKVQVSYNVSHVDMTIDSVPRQRLKIEKLNGELNVEACSTRVEASKNRIVLQLAKKRETTWYDLTKK